MVYSKAPPYSLDGVFVLDGWIVVVTIENDLKVLLQRRMTPSFDNQGCCFAFWLVLSNTNIGLFETHPGH